VDSALALAHEAFPKIASWGTLFDPADPFAEHYLGIAKREAERLGIPFVTLRAPVHRTLGPASKRFARKAWAGSCRFRAS
jgi:hypothetical protein